MTDTDEEDLELDDDAFEDDDGYDDETDDEEAEADAATERSGQAKGFALGLLLGVAVGAGVALLFAPASGRVTRRRIRRGIADARDRIDDDLRRLRRQVRQLRAER